MFLCLSVNKSSFELCSTPQSQAGTHACPPATIATYRFMLAIIGVEEKPARKEAYLTNKRKKKNVKNKTPLLT